MHYLTFCMMLEMKMMDIVIAVLLQPRTARDGNQHYVSFSITIGTYTRVLKTGLFHVGLLFLI